MDIPWDSFDPTLLSDEQARTIKMNAITEWAALPATEMFLRDNRDDSDFSAFMSIGFFEEQKHSLVLMEYLRRFRPDLVPTEQELHDIRFEFDPAPALETLMLHSAVRSASITGTAGPASGIPSRSSRASMPTQPGRGPPWRRLSEVHEARHREIWPGSQGRLCQSGGAHGQRAPHGAGLASDQSACEQGTLPCDTIQSLLLGRSFQTVQELNRYRKELIQEMAAALTLPASPEAV